MGAFAAKSIKEFASFEQGMNEVFTLLPGITKDAMGKMTDETLAFSKSMGIVPEEVVPALYQALSAGIPQDNVFEFMETAVKASKAGVVDLNTAVDALSTVVNTYGKENITAARAADIMFEAVKMGKTTFGEMSATMYNVLPVAKAAGIGFEEIAAAVATMTAKGTPTAQVMTQLKAAITSMIAPSTRSVKLFAEYGLSVSDLSKMIQSPGGLVKAMNAIKTATNGDMVAMKRLLGSSEALNAVLTLTSDGGQKFSQVLSGMANNSGQADAAFQRMNTGLMRSFEKMTAAFKVSMIKFGKALAPLLDKVTPVIMNIIGQIDSINWAALINGFARVWVIGLKPTFDAVRMAIMSMPWGKLGEFLLPVAGLVIKTIQKLGIIIVGLAPMIVPAIETLVGYFVVLYRNIFLVIHFISKVAKDLGIVWRDMLQVSSAAMAFLIDPTKAKFLDLIETLKNNFGNLGGNLTKLFRTIAETLKNNFGWVVESVVEGFKYLVAQGGAALQEWISKVPGLTNAIAEVQSIFKWVRHSIIGEIKAMIGAFSDLGGGLEQEVEWTNLFREAIQYLTSSFAQILVQIIRFVGGLIQILGLVTKIVIRLITELAPALSQLLPLVFKIAAAAIFFLIEGIKACMFIINGLIKTFMMLEPTLMFIVSIVAGFVAAVVEGLKAIWTYLKYFYLGCVDILGEIAVAFVECFYGIKGAVGDVIDWILGLFKKLKDYVYHILFGGTISKDFKKCFDFIEKVVSKVMEKINKIFKMFKEVARIVLEGVAVVFNTIFDGIATVVETLGDIVARVFESIGKQIKMILGAFTNMAKTIERIFDKVLELGGKAVKLAGKVIGGAAGLASSALGAVGLGGGGGAKGARDPGTPYPINQLSLKTSLRPIIKSLASMDTSLKSIDKTLKGKFVNQ